MRRIAHLDMDAFFASVELLKYPELRGEAVVVGGRGPKPEPGRWDRLRGYRGRGVVTTATYEARALGVHSGLGLMKAAALAPDAILLPADFEAYRRCSRLFKEAVAALAPAIEDRGIDEIYIDLTDLPGDARTIGGQLKAAVKAATGLTCSLGITPNKLLSKIASELDKPDGLTVLGLDDIPARIWPLPARAVNGIGPKAAARLEALGIRSLGDLAGTDPAVLRGAFGEAYGTWLAAAARGQDDRPIVVVREVKSVSRETTFPRDLHPRQDREALAGILLDLCERLAGDLARKGLRARTVGVKVRYADFRTVTWDQTLAAPVAEAGPIREGARACLRRVDLDRPLRLLGVRLAGLEPAQAPVQPELPFGD